MVLATYCHAIFTSLWKICDLIFFRRVVNTNQRSCMYSECCDLYIYMRQSIMFYITHRTLLFISMFIPKSCVDDDLLYMQVRIHLFFQSACQRNWECCKFMIFGIAISPASLVCLQALISWLDQFLYNRTCFMGQQSGVSSYREDQC